MPHRKTWKSLSKGNLERETEYRVIAAQNNYKCCVVRYTNMAMCEMGEMEIEC